MIYSELKIMFLKNKFQIAFILLVLFASSFVRFYQLGKVPNGLTVDEADMGYNAYSILKTQKDVYGEKLPLFFQALDDYKPGLVFYTTLPAIFLFGLNDFSVRLAPAIFGTLSIILLFVLTKTLYPKNQLLPYISALLVSFAPWHIALSRAMVWYIELIFLYLLFFVFFVFAQKEYLKAQTKLFTLSASAIFLSLTLYVYYAAVIYLPLILLALTYIYMDFFKKNLKILLTGLSILLILSLPAFLHYSSPESKTRLNVISVLTPDITLPTSIKELEQDQQLGLPFSQFIHNRRLVYASALADNYFDYFNLDYLFVTAKNIRYFYVNGIGLFYLIELPFFLYGLYTLVRRREKSDLLILALLVIGPIPAMLTLGSPFPHRALLFILALQIISAIGITSFITNQINRQRVNILRAKREVTLKNIIILAVSSRPFDKLRARTIIFILFFVYGASVYFFLHQYFVHSKNEFTSELDNGAWYSTVKDAIPKVNLYKDGYERIIFTWSQGKVVPGVYFYLYNQVDPRILQTKAAKWTNEQPSYRQIYDNINNIEFRPINWESDKNLKKTLFVGYPSEFPPDVEVIDRTYLPNGNVHFLLVETH